MYGFWGSNFHFHILPISLSDAVALMNVYYKVWNVPLLLLPVYASKREYQCITPQDIKQGIINRFVATKKYVVKNMTYVYNRIATVYKLKPKVLKGMPSLPPRPSPKEKVESSRDNLKYFQESVKKTDNIKPYACEGYRNFCSTREMIEQYISDRSKTINVQPTCTEYLVNLRRGAVVVCTEQEIKMMFAYKDLLFPQVINMEIIPIARTVPRFMLDMFEDGSVSNRSYFLQMSYNVRKYLGCHRKPCKKRTLFKHMQHIFNNYQFDYGQETSFLDLYLDAKDSDYSDVDTFIEELRFLGYTVKNGQVMHLKKRITPLDVCIEDDKKNEEFDTYAHKVLRQPGGNDWRSVPKNPFSDSVSPFNMASI